MNKSVTVAHCHFDNLTTSLKSTTDRDTEIPVKPIFFA